MTAVAISLASLALLLGGVIAWLVYRNGAATDQLSQERIAHTKTRATLEREQFIHDATKAQLVETERVAAALEEVLADVQSNPNADLPPGDIAARVRRAAAQAARDRAGAAGPSAGATLPSTGAAAEPGATGVSAVVGLDDKLLKPDA